jgi:hypothetical protein
MEQFAMKTPYPTKTGGNKTIRFFRFSDPSISAIANLSEGTTPSSNDERDLTLSSVEATLVQYGSKIILTDVLLATELFSHLAQATKQLGEDAALHADTLCHRALVQDSSTSTGTGVATKSYARYAQNGTNGTTFGTASTPNSSMTATDLLDGATSLFIARAPKIKDGYALVAHPAVIRDLQQDDDWLKVSSYSAPDKTSPAPSTKEKSMKEGMVKLPLSMFELGEGEENANPEVGDMVELEGKVERIDGDMAIVSVSNAMAEESESEESNKPEMSEEDRMMKMAEESDKENYA